MNKLPWRIGAVLVHALINILLITYLTNFDLTGTWWRVAGFIVLLAALLMFFIIHILSFINFIKTKTK